jgi:hypothetical protein
MSLRFRIVGIALSAACLSFAAPAKTAEITYSKDVAPILFNKCAGCHRAGEIAPMSLLNYSETRPWAKSIRQAVVGKVMPPWFADPNVGHFKNDARLPQSEIGTIVKWVDAGAPEGNKADLPPAPKFVEGWVLGKPDVVIEMPEEFDVPAEGVIPYKYFTAHTNFTEDKWVRGVEIRAGQRSVVHHIILSLQQPGAAPSTGEAGDVRGGRRVQLAGTAPGLQPTWYPEGIARQIKAGSDIVFQMHYTPNGKAVKDKSYVGLFFSKEPPTRVSGGGGIMNFRFKIPPGDPDYAVESTWTAPEDVELTGMMPHMHMRGKDFKYTAVFPDGHSEVVLNVPHYNFNWQLHYTLAEPKFLPKGTRIDCVAHYDNSANNKSNPDPTKVVSWGDQTFDEMMIGYFDYLPVKQPAQVHTAAK